ncbi:MAG: NAD-binding protein [Rhizobiales bacterium]|nr:NAD-binding protein [Hyphomicrobiales bacterium]
MAATRTIGLIGTGIMGGHIARRLATAGHRVRAWNRTPDKLAPLAAHAVAPAATPAAAADGADLVIVMVSDGPASDEVLGTGGAAAAGPGTVFSAARPPALVVVMSSIPVETAERQARLCAQKAMAYLDAPVSGGEPGARDGRLVIMAGGSAEGFAAARPVLEVLGRPTHMGPAGAGSLAKLANQLIVGATIATVAEALLLVEKGGGRPDALVDALAGGFADSPILQNHGRRMVSGDFRAGGPSRIQLKDLETVRALADRLSLRLPMAGEALSLYRDLVAEGDGELDHNAAWRQLRRRNGLA